MFYADDGISFLNLRFENDVKMYGTQAVSCESVVSRWFENDVKMYGTQAALKICLLNWKFENDVKMYGTQAKTDQKTRRYGLRMM